jgi:hypothetical protein
MSSDNEADVAILVSQVQNVADYFVNRQPVASAVSAECPL